MNPFHPAWRASADVRPRIDAFSFTLAIVFAAALGAVGCSGASDEPAPITHHDSLRNADTVADAPDAAAREDASAPAPASNAPPASSDWATAGGSGGGGAAPAGSSKANQPKRVQ